jgi:hypothetical protein
MAHSTQQNSGNRANESVEVTHLTAPHAERYRCQGDRRRPLFMGRAVVLADIEPWYCLLASFCPLRALQLLTYLPTYRLDQ